jgi:hypothetical protein
MSFEKSSHDPLTNVESDALDQFFNSSIILNSHFSNSLSEENVEGVQTVLVHPIYNVQSNDKEI